MNDSQRSRRLVPGATRASAPRFEAEGGSFAGTLGLARVGSALVLVLALTFGFVGIWQYVHDPRITGFGTSFWDVLYYDLQLFVLGSEPLSTPGPFPWSLEVARFAAPATALYALFEAGRALFATSWRQWRQSRATGHVIVVGTTPIACSIAMKETAAGRRVVTIPAGDPERLRTAGVSGASIVYACVDDSDDTVNLAVALSTVQADRKAPGLRVYAQVSDATLCLALRARRLALPGDPDLHLDFFDPEHLAARTLLSTADIDPPAEVTPHVMIVGLGPFGRTILIEYARHWRLRSRRRAERLRVTLVDPNAHQVAREITRSWQVVAETCELVPLEAALDEILSAPSQMPPYRIFLCWEDEDRTLRTVLTATALWNGGPRSIVVRLNRLASYDEAFSSSGPDVLDDLGGRLNLVNVSELASDPTIIQEDLMEYLARIIHERYWVERLRRGDAALGSDEGMQEWQFLDEDLRNANRAQARDIGTKLQMINCTTALNTNEAPFVFRPTEIDRLAEHEHERWCADRRAAGWRYSPERDNAGRYHPSLIPWHELSEAERDKDRDTVSNLPAILADVGLQIVRLDL